MKCEALRYFVGLSITRSRPDKTDSVLISARLHKKILKQFYMTDCHTKGTPAQPGCRLTFNTDKESIGNVQYREEIGSLLYLTISSYPDIAFAIGKVAKFAENPQHHHSSPNICLSQRHARARNSVRLKQ